MPPTVDVVMSTFNEERYVERCLDAVIGQDYAPELVRIWAVDGGSTDRTLDLLRSRAAREPRLTVIANGRLNLPEALNLGIERSSGTFVAKIDAHGYPAPDFLRRAIEALDSAGPEVGCVGGMPVQEGETGFGQGLAVARGSAFGVGGGSYAITGDRRSVPSVQCGVYRRAVLEQVGLFDPEMNFGEDDELNWRVTQAGHQILLDRRVRFHYFTRRTWAAAFRQYRNYGKARVLVVRKHPGFLRPHHLAPAVFVCGLGALAGSAAVSRNARRLLAATTAGYAALALAAARPNTAHGDPTLTLFTAAAFPALHLGYGVGMVLGGSAVARAASAAPDVLYEQARRRGRSGS